MDKTNVCFVYVTEEDIKRETENLVKNIKEKDKTKYIFNGEFLYKTGGGGHCFGFGFYTEYITKSGIRATGYRSGYWVIGSNDYELINDEFIKIEHPEPQKINWDHLTFPTIKNISTKTIGSQLKSYKPKRK